MGTARSQIDFGGASSATPVDATGELPTATPDARITSTVFSDPPEQRRAANERAANDLVLGSTIGRFVVLERIGKGAAGAVYKAYDPTLAREVALKRLHARASDSQDRLLDEARAMARVSHPNVVVIHEVFVDDDAVVLAMEYVAGTTLQEWTRAEGRSWRAIVETFRAAGGGLLAAHRAGLVHRDFKPANVLVGRDGRILVTDFGIASFAGVEQTTGDASSHEPGMLRSHTRAQGIVGTPWYMAPEQHRGGKIDARSDQFAFCLALWEALCGASPFAGHTVAELEAAKLVGPPVWPKHVAIPAAVADALRRGLATDPNERFVDMAAALERLAHDPAARRRHGLSLAVAGSALTLAGGWGYAWQAERAELCIGAPGHLETVWNDQRRAELVRGFAGTGVPVAPATAQRVAGMLDAYTDAWASQFNENCAATAIRAEQSQAVMDLRTACLRRSMLELRATIDVLMQADAQVVERGVAMVGALAPPQRCEDAEALAEGQGQSVAPEDAARVEEVQAHIADAHALERAGKYERALERVAEARALSANLEHSPTLAELAHVRGTIESSFGRIMGEQFLREALHLALRTGLYERASHTASALAHHLAVLQRRPAEARVLAEVALELATQRRDDVGRAKAYHCLALASREQGRYDDSISESRHAIEIWESMSGIDEISVFSARESLALALEAQGHYADAEAEHRRVLAARERLLGPDHSAVGFTRNNIGAVLYQQGHLDEASAEFERAVALLERAVGPRNPALINPAGNLAAVLQDRGRDEEAEQLLRRVLDLAQRSFGPAHPDVGHVRHNLGYLLVTQRKFAEADEQLRQSLAVTEAAFGPDHPNVAHVLDTIGLSALRQRKLHDAMEVLQRAARILEAALPPEHPMLASARRDLAEAHLGLGDTEDARSLLEQAWETHADASSAPKERAATAFALAKILVATERPRALDLAHTAVALYAEAGASSVGERMEVEGWLAERGRAG